MSFPCLWSVRASIRFILRFSFVAYIVKLLKQTTLFYNISFAISL